MFSVGRARCLDQGSLTPGDRSIAAEVPRMSRLSVARQSAASRKRFPACFLSCCSGRQAAGLKAVLVDIQHSDL